MSSDTDKPKDAKPDDGAEQPQVEHTDVELAYAGASRLITAEGEARLALFGNVHRDPVRLEGEIKQPLRLREGLAALYAVVGSDYRYVPKDRSAYQAYLRMRRESANLGAWQAQQAYFSWLQRNDPLAFLILDPIITVHPDRVLLEAFSKDEGTYANFSVGLDAFSLDGEPTCGTTNIDFSQSLYEGILQFRSYRKTRVSIGQEAVAVDTDEGSKVLEKQIKIPDSWLRGFLQVQSAAMLPRDTFSISPIDLYNALRHLRMNADQKGKRRGLRVELVPGEQPHLVLEPWETVIKATAGVYQGKQAKVVRVWGRRRLMLLRRMLPFVEEVEVHVMGSGLPSFWVLKAGEMTFTLGLTGFTSANWSQAAAFDLLLARKTQGSEQLEKVVKHLAGKWADDEKGLADATGLKGAELLEALQLGCQQGQLMYDIAQGVYRLRPLTNVPLDMQRLEYRNQRERMAHDLTARKDAVTISTENRIHGTGLEITGKIEVKEDKREYRTQLLINDDGYVSRAECTCTTFRKQGLKGGPCTHLVALRLAYAQRETRRRESGKARKTITVETRTYCRRLPDGEEIYQVSLDRKRVKVRWGRAGEDLRVQQLQFNSVGVAREDYLARVDSLQARGFLDASTG